MDNWPETNASLIRRIKDPADERAWMQFLAIYRPVVVRLAVSRGMQHADAEDLAQQVFVAVAAAIENWQPTRSGRQFCYWLNRVSRNAITNALTRIPLDRAAGSLSAEALLHEVSISDEPLSVEVRHAARMESIRWASREIKHEFSEATWLMFWLSTVDGQPVDQVAKVVGKSRGAVYIARCRVTQRLKEVVEQTGAIGSESE